GAPQSAAGAQARSAAQPERRPPSLHRDSEQAPARSHPCGATGRRDRPRRAIGKDDRRRSRPSESAAGGGPRCGVEADGDQASAGEGDSDHLAQRGPVLAPRVSAASPREPSRIVFSPLRADRWPPTFDYAHLLPSGSTIGNPVWKSTNSPHKSKTARTFPLAVMSPRSNASARVRCPRMRASKTGRVVVTVVSASGTIFPAVEVRAPCWKVDASDSPVSVNLQLITIGPGVPARGPLTRVPR